MKTFLVFKSSARLHNSVQLSKSTFGAKQNPSQKIKIHQGGKWGICHTWAGITYFCKAEKDTFFSFSSFREKISLFGYDWKARCHLPQNVGWYVPGIMLHIDVKLFLEAFLAKRVGCTPNCCTLMYPLYSMISLTHYCENEWYRECCLMGERGRQCYPGLLELPVLASMEEQSGQ